MKSCPLIFCLILFTFSLSALSQTDLPDPKEILTKAEAAVQNLKTISYHAEQYNIGMIKYGEHYAILAPLNGKVKLTRILNGDPIGAKLIILGESIVTNRLTPFEVIYDGEKIKKLDRTKKIVFVNDPDEKGKYLLVGAIDLVLDEFKNDESFKHELSASEIKYGGLAVIDGILCHIIHFLFPEHSDPGQIWWFFGVEDYLPRQVRKLYDRNPDQKHEEILRLSQLRPNITINEDEFNLFAPEGFQVKEYKGFGKRKPSISVGDIAPDWILSDPLENQYSLRDFKGKIVVIDFWATWCLPCVKKMPEIQKIHEQFKDKGVRVFGINIWDQGDPIKIMHESGYTYHLLLKGDGIAKEYGINGIPTLYVIGKDGKIIFNEVGFKEDLYERVIEILNAHLNAK